MVSEVRYARSSSDVHIAYRVAGEGPFDVVLVPGTTSHVELAWEVPFFRALFKRIASFARLIHFDKRGTGMSDAADAAAPLEVRMDDVRAVMDAVGSERASIFGMFDGAPMSTLFAATYPDRTWALILDGAIARTSWAQGYPWGTPEMDARAALEEIAARPNDPARLADVARLASPNAQVPRNAARFVADQIPGATYVELHDKGNIPPVAESEPYLREVQSFLERAWDAAVDRDTEPDRVLATVLFTDIVASSEHAARLGDRGWRDLLQQHHELVRRELLRYRGVEVDTAGDGFFASFDGPARAIRCAGSITDSVQELGIAVRAGLHTGECEVVDGKVTGIAVHTGARVASQAQPGEVLVSSTVKDLVAGSGIEFEDRGTAELKGIPGNWRLFAVAKSRVR
jgi:class 3 adenylate cyclase